MRFKYYFMREITNSMDEVFIRRVGGRRDSRAELYASVKA